MAKSEKRPSSECVARPERFGESISKVKLLTFATGSKRYKIKSGDEKIKAVTMVRDLFGSILFMSLQRKVDMGEVLKYPLTPVPLSIAHTDNMMQKKPKVKLLNEIEKRINHIPPETVDVTIVDGMFFYICLVSCLRRLDK